MKPVLENYTDDEGRIWKPYSVQFESADGPFSFFIMATSHLHAEILTAEIRESATVVGEIVGIT